LIETNSLFISLFIDPTTTVAGASNHRLKKEENISILVYEN